MSGSAVVGPETGEQFPLRDLGQETLPIFKHKDEIIRSLINADVTIIDSPTGTGKTTQVPQFAHELGVFDEIIVTQPRIVAARELSERVDTETSDATSIGYFTSREGTKTSQESCDIKFLTDGKAASQLLFERDATRDKRRLLIIDEVHEWNPHTELLIALATSKTNPRSPEYDPKLKVVIMSATMDTQGLANHFAKADTNTIHVEGKRHPVEEISTRASIENVVLQSVDRNPKSTVLVFLPGISDIRSIRRNLRENGITKPVISLHAKQSEAQQKKALREYPNGAIILTTNVAESSLTLPKVDVVVDCGEAWLDNVEYGVLPTGAEELNLIHAPNSSLQQRRGRAGRTGPGKAILASIDGSTPVPPPNERLPFQIPAIQRGRLDELVLKLKCSNYDIKDLPFYHAPQREAITASELRLYNLGAIDELGAPTPIGRQMSRLPLDVEFASMLARAKSENLDADSMQSLIDIATIMQLGGIFDRSPKRQNWKELLTKDDEADPKESESDFFAQLEAYCRLIETVPEEEWSQYHINAHAIKIVETSRQILASRLRTKLGPSTPVGKENRHKILKYINLAQINQLWQKQHGSLVEIFTGTEVPANDSTTVALRLGEFATGKLFTLGIDPNDPTKRIATVGDINRIPNIRELSKKMGRLVVETVDFESLRFNPGNGKFTIKVHRKIGNLSLGSTTRDRAEFMENGPTEQMLSNVFRKTMFHELQKDKTKKRPPLSLDDTNYALNTKSPEEFVFGEDPFTGDKLIAYRCGNGRWTTDKNIALRSLEARQKQLLSHSDKVRAKNNKNTAVQLEATLRNLDGLSDENLRTLRILINNRPGKGANLESWIDDVQEFLQSLGLNN